MSEPLAFDALTTGKRYAQAFAEGITPQRGELDKHLAELKVTLARYKREEPNTKRLHLGPLTIVVAQPIKVLWR